MPLPVIDDNYLVSFLSGLLNTPSPTGYTLQAVSFTEQALEAFPELKLSRTRKGALVVEWPGRQSDAPRALTAHADTLGAMVKEIKPNGRLMLTKIGGFAWNSVEGEGCTVFTQNHANAARLPFAYQSLITRLQHRSYRSQAGRSQYGSASG